MADTRLMLVKPGEKRRSGGAAASRVVELCETQAIARQPIKVRRFGLRAVAADVAEPHVVDHDDDDIRFVGSGDRLRRDAKDTAGDQRGQNDEHSRR